MKKLGFFLAVNLLASSALAGDWAWIAQTGVWTGRDIIVVRQTEKGATDRARIYADVEHHRIEADKEARNNQTAADVLTSGASGSATAKGGTVTANNTNPGTTHSGFARRRP